MAVWDKDADSEIEMIKNLAWKTYDEKEDPEMSIIKGWCTANL